MYTINYLRHDAVESFRTFFPTKKKTEILRILSKSLGYKSFGHLKREYNLKDENLIFSLKNEDKEKRFFDISRYGYIFNEYALMTYLSIEYEEALKIKYSIDLFEKKIDKEYFDGNLECSDISLLNKYLKVFPQSSEKRIMANFPFSFYCRKRQNIDLIVNDKKETLSFFEFDGFDESFVKYYKGNLLMFTENILKEFLKYDNIVFDSNLVNYYEGKLSDGFFKIYLDFDIEKKKLFFRKLLSKFNTDLGLMFNKKVVLIRKKQN